MAGKAKTVEAAPEEPAAPAGPAIAEDGSIALEDYERMTPEQVADFCWSQGRMFSGAVVDGKRVWI